MSVAMCVCGHTFVDEGALHLGVALLRAPRKDNCLAREGEGINFEMFLGATHFFGE